MTIIVRIYFFVLSLLVVFSYGFKDPNLNLTANPLIQSLINPLFHLVYYERPWTTVLFFLFISFLFVLYLFLLKNTQKKIAWMIVIGGIILTFNFLLCI